ncbi:uncharacterized protein LOC122624285 [Drosophila teissieri]|uniref:uncharacterized protein LOC122624285 n=1 Tax=Drosophila teissieri TaxID=7243 RepID=UPI001CBA45BB|nr:uncharacterized protein LOC122624285 [Drosophila teissieri]
MLQNATREVAAQGGRPRIGFFFKQSELMRMLPEIPKLLDIYDLFLVNGHALAAGGDELAALVCMDPGVGIRLTDVADCLRTMGLSPSDDVMRTHLAELVRRREAMGIRIARRATFELVLTLYCRLAEREVEEELDKGSSVEDVLRVLRKRDPDGTGMLPYSQLRRMLTTMGSRLDEAEAYGVLHCVADIDGNVHYEQLVRQLYAKDPLAEERLQQAQLYLQAVGRNAIDMDMGKRDEFIDAIRRADPMGTGFIQPERLLELLNRNEEQFTSEELQLLTQGMEDTRCERGINYHRFLQFIMNE